VNIERDQISEDILKSIVFGLTGKNASGKGTVAEILKKKNFTYHSLSDSLRDELKSLKKEETRENLIDIGNELREKGGPGVLADKLMPKLNSENNHIVDSIRNPLEVISLRKETLLRRFFLISVDANSKLRYDRLCSRGRIGDTDSWEKFVEQEKKEENNDDPNKQQLSRTMEMADYSIDNSGTLEELEAQVNRIISSL
jgi:dephospho-CoA kinase|tara:strand:- start:39 stop:635 length:597 start_codon:yes stop_codon:yes gene_type:complete